MSSYNIFETQPNTYYIGKRPGKYVYDNPSTDIHDALRRVYALYFVEGLQDDFNNKVFRL